MTHEAMKQRKAMKQFIPKITVLNINVLTILKHLEKKVKSHEMNMQLNEIIGQNVTSGVNNGCLMHYILDVTLSQSLDDDN